jgi:hypothetical protein
MKDLKFRMWDNEDKMMREVSNITFFDGKPELVGYRVFSGDERTQKFPPIMQYTGLNDPYKKEIYVGDMFGLMGGDKERPNEYEIHGVVYFDDELAAFCVDNQNGGWVFLHEYMWTKGNQKEVIGNIHENK